VSQSFPPLESDHPLVGRPCPICQRPFEAGDVTTLITVRPAGSENEQRMRDGRYYTAEAAPTHVVCAAVTEPFDAWLHAFRSLS
jgi:hypothetical protein